jgi:sialate O-acetylesterase
MLWYRTTVSLTAEQAASPALISIGAADEVDTSWVNGVAVGSDYHPGSNRTYKIPKGVLKPGANTVVINVLDTWSGGGLGGDPALRAISFANGERVPLTEAWEYQLVPAGIGSPPRAPWETNAGLSSIYNGMIAPLGNYGVKGFAWYQGESDASTAANYRFKLRSLISDWRSQFGSADLPFLVVQLPGWGARVPVPTESDFANIREEQRAAVAAERNAGLAVTIDVGDPTDLHPGNKQDVGRRLARAARHLAYGEAIAPSGPEFANAQRDGDAIAISFKHVEGQLVTYSAARPIGFELCGPQAGSCRFVEARIEGERVLLEIGSGPAARVRYCWGDSPLCNLHDGSGLPVGPFEAKLQ